MLVKNQEKLKIIDAISPFFIDMHDEVINWSKINFNLIEKDNIIDKIKFKKIKNNFLIFIKKAKKHGYDSITLDDVAHLTILDFYSKNLKKKIQSYQKHFHSLFKIAKKHGMKIFLTTDIMFFNKDIQKNLKNNNFEDLFKSICENCILQNSFIDGIITRIGEPDGVDVKDDFKSSLVIKTPEQANSLIKKIIPVFEKHNKKLIFRTWTVGAYEIGDLIWNKKTFINCFKSINSDIFIISMKYGESDFFRFLRLSELFFELDHIPKIIELQTKREYEGFGEYPSFVGWDYEIYLRKLQKSNLIGIQVWCQTGGWSRFNRLTYLDNSSIWVEINNYVTSKLFDRFSTKDALKEFHNTMNLEIDLDLFIEFLKLADDVIKQILYFEDFAKKPLYFRRVKIPTNIWVYWEHVTINDYIYYLYSLYVKEIHQNSIEKLKKMINIVKKSSLLNQGLIFQYDTFEILEKAKKYMIYDTEKKELDKLIKIYNKKYKIKYEFNIEIKNRSSMIKHFLFILIRKRKQYRLVDKIFTSKPITNMIIHLLEKNSPKFIGKRAMPISSVLK